MAEVGLMCVEREGRSRYIYIEKPQDARQSGIVEGRKREAVKRDRRGVRDRVRPLGFLGL